MSKIMLPLFFLTITIISVLFMAYITYLSLQSMPSFLIVIFFFTAILVLLNYLFKKIKKRYLRKIIKISSLVLTVLILFITFSTFKTISFIKNLSGETEYIKTYYVVALKENNYQLEDITKITVYENSDSSKVIEQLKRVISFETITSFDLGEIVDQLTNNQIQAILIEKNIHDLLIEEIETFDQKTIILYQVELTSKIEVMPITVDPTEKPFNVLITGIDSYGDIKRVGRSDVNVVINVNPKTRKIVIISIPRDYYVNIHGEDKLKDKLAHSGIYGTEKTIKTVENLLDIEINYYLKVNFNSIIELVEAIGIITVNSEYHFESGGYRFYKGENQMDGYKALAFLRHRYTLPGGDRGRNLNHQIFINGVIEKATTPAVLMRYNTILHKLENKIIFNMEEEKIIAFIKKELNSKEKWQIVNYGLNGFDASDYTYTSSKSKRYVMIPDQETVEEAKELIIKNKGKD